MSRSPSIYTQTTPTSSSAPSRSSSFFAFRSKPSMGSSPPNKLHRASSSNPQPPPLQQRSPPQGPISQAPLQNAPPPPPPQQQQQQQQPKPPQQTDDQQPSPTNDPPLHPEIRSIVSLTMAHTQKIYFSGPLMHKLDRSPDGHRPQKDGAWHDVWAQLYGTTLSIWNMGEVKMANKQGREVPPSYVNVTEAFVHVLGALTQPGTATSPPRKYTNVITLNTAGTNLLLFACPSPQDLISWAAAFRLSCWEKSRLEEIYTAHLMRIALNDGRNTPSTLTHGRLEGWVRVRTAGQTSWKKLWMCVTAGALVGAARSSTDVASINSKSPLSPGNSRNSYLSPKKNRISGLFSRDKNELPERANISLYSVPRGKDKKKPILTFEFVTQAFAVYPERPKLISSSTLIKLEGTYGSEEMCANMSKREGWMLMMPDLEGARNVSGETLKWLIGIHDAFELYGRPKAYSWDPRDPVSMMFSYPIGPEKQLLFLDRSVAEALDPREERTPLVRSKLLSIMVQRLRPSSDPSPEAVQNPNAIPQPATAAAGLVGQNQNQQPKTPVPQPGLLSFEQVQQQQLENRDDNWARPPPHPNDRRALTPITERSTRDSNSGDASANPPPLHRPGLSTINSSPLQPDQIQKQQSEASQELPKLQTDAESSTFLGEGIVTSPTSNVPLHEFGIGQTDSAGPFGSKPDPHQPKQEPDTLSRPDPKFDTRTSTDHVQPPGGSIGSPLSPPGKEPVLPAPPPPHSHQPIPPVQPTFSAIPKTPPRSPGRPAFAPIRKGPEAESELPTPGSSSRLQGEIQRKEGNGTPNLPTTATKTKTPEPTSRPQTDSHPNNPAFSPTPTTANSLPTLTHTTTTTSIHKSEYSGYSDSSKQTPPQYAQGSFSSPDHLNRDSPSRSSQSRVQDETFQNESLTSLSGNVRAVKPLGQTNGGKGGSGDDLIKEAGALYYIQETQDAAVPPPRIVGRGQNIPMSSRGQSGSDDDEDERKPSTHDLPRPPLHQIQTQSQPRQLLPPEPSPLQLRKPSAHARASLPPTPSQPPPRHSTQPSPDSSQNKYQDHGYAQGREQQPILAPQPQQPAASSFNPVETMEGDVRSPNLYYTGRDANNVSSVVDSRRASVIGIGTGGGQGGGSRSGQVSRPSGARDLVQKQRAGTSDSASSHSRHNCQQPHPLPPHPESPPDQSSQSSYHTHAQFLHHQGQIVTQAPQAIDTASRHPVNMANLDQHRSYDDNSDALAALTFLERDESNSIPKPPPPPPLLERVGPTTHTYNTPPVHVTPPESRDDASQDSGSYEAKYKSSFAPSKQAARRLANTQAQQAAHQAATHRPGKSGGANGKGKRRVRQDSWAESSDEEDEDEDEDDEEVDSDGDPVTQRLGQGHGAGPGQNLGRLSAQGSPYGSSTDLNHPGQGKPQRNLPRPPSGDQGEYYHQQGPGGSGPSTVRQPPEHHPRIHQYDRKPSPQPHGHSNLRPQSDFPTPGAARQTIWSQALENKGPELNSQRETFVQIEPSHTMTKAFAVHGLLSAGLQDRQERSAKRQEEVAKETGASLVNVPTKPPPPQTGLLGAVSAHERERQREGGIGAALTERERDRRMAEERQRKLDDFQKQQLEMVQNGSMYGSPGLNPMMTNPMMNPMMGGWGFNPMMANPQQMIVAQQAAAQAYQQAMMTFAQTMGQNQAGEGPGGMGGMGSGMAGMGSGMGGMGSPGMLSPMVTGQQAPMMTGQFDPRMSMMGMPMMGMMGMGMGMGMGPMNPMMTGQSGMVPGMGAMGGGLGAGTNSGAGVTSHVTGGSVFDPRMSPSQFDLGGSANPSPSHGSPAGPRPLDAPPQPPRSPANFSPGPR